MSSPAIIRFFKEEGYGVLLGRIGITIVFTGLASIALLGLINEVAFNGRQASEDLSYYLVAMGIFALGTRYLNIRVTRLVEQQLLRLRLRIMEGVRNSELTHIERLGREDIHVALSQDVALVSNSADMLISAVQQAVMLLFCMIYVAWLSPLAFIVVLGSIVATYFLIAKLQSILQKNYQRLAAEENKLFAVLDHLVNGFKEIKINAKKSSAIAAEYDRYLKETERLKVDNRIRSSWAILASHLFMYSLLGAVVFALPMLVGSGEGLIGKLVATILFIITPLLLILEGIPTIERANTSLQRLYDLDSRFADSVVHAPRADVAPDFQKLTLRGVTYCYPDDDGNPGFTVGPLNSCIKQGEIVFLTGGNGSGKSTLLKLLTGLYSHHQGQLVLNKEVIGRGNRDKLREQFAVVFTDFHLFDRFYGQEDVDEKYIHELIQQMELQDKVSYQEGRFSTMRLSTGQRKRLALIMALLDDRNIYVFDEWAADQDAHFRDRFYKDILPSLQARGKTVIAVTHDDRYWDCCDRLIKMDLGGIQEQTQMDAFPEVVSTV